MPEDGNERTSTHRVERDIQKIIQVWVAPRNRQAERKGEGQDTGRKDRVEGRGEELSAGNPMTFKKTLSVAH